jgi:thymidylate synthase
MLTIKRPNFAIVRDVIEQEFSKTKPVVRSMWQGVDVSKKPDMKTHELAHVAISVDLRGRSDLQWHRDLIKPNLPWADDHFEERVCGYPINPGVEWANWPWGSNADKFRTMSPGPDVPSQDWAYLAGILDGDGTIYFRDSGRGVVRVYRRDRSVCDQLLELFRVGRVANSGEDYEAELPGGRVADSSMFCWQIDDHDECKWLLEGLTPFLRIKKHEAEQALAFIKARHSSGDYERKRIWGRDWEPRFNHNYMSRYWPRGDNGSPYIGMYGNRYGDLNDVVGKLCSDPGTRQAILPVYFPEDTALRDARQPCSIYYHFIRNGNALDVVYAMRSCDFKRHWADDVYLTVRLLLWVIDKCKADDATRPPDLRQWRDVVPGEFVMHIANLHIFAADFVQMYGRRS